MAEERKEKEGARRRRSGVRSAVQAGVGDHGEQWVRGCTTQGHHNPAMKPQPRVLALLSVAVQGTPSGSRSAGGCPPQLIVAGSPSLAQPSAVNAARGRHRPPARTAPGLAWLLTSHPVTHTCCPTSYTVHTHIADALPAPPFGRAAHCRCCFRLRLRLRLPRHGVCKAHRGPRACPQRRKRNLRAQHRDRGARARTGRPGLPRRRPRDDQLRGAVCPRAVLFHALTYLPGPAHPRPPAGSPQQARPSDQRDAQEQAAPEGPGQDQRR